MGYDSAILLQAKLNTACFERNLKVNIEDVFDVIQREEFRELKRQPILLQAMFKMHGWFACGIPLYSCHIIHSTLVRCLSKYYNVRSLLWQTLESIARSKCIHTLAVIHEIDHVRPKMFHRMNVHPIS